MSRSAWVSGLLTARVKSRLCPFKQEQHYQKMCPFFGLKSVLVLYKLQQFLYERPEGQPKVEREVQFLQNQL